MAIGALRASNDDKLCSENRKLTRDLRQREQKEDLKQERLDEARQKARIEEEERIPVRETFRKRQLEQDDNDLRHFLDNMKRQRHA